jgi:hypothetical protein
LPLLWVSSAKGITPPISTIWMSAEGRSGTTFDDSGLVAYCWTHGGWALWACAQ